MKHTSGSIRAGLWICVAALTVSIWAGAARATVYTAKGSYTGYWADPNTWTNNNGAWPGEGDDVEISNPGSVVILSATSSNLGTVTIGSTLVFTNWNSALRATTVSIGGSGVLTMPAAFSTNSGASNNIYVACTTFTLAAGGVVNADVRGYAGTVSAGWPLSWPGQGPGAGYGWGGGSYGGKGGGSGGTVYGNVEAPLAPGSSGGSMYSAYASGAGGGAVRIEGSGTVTINGTITANGGEGNSSSSGSGGGIYIACDGLAGSGLVRAMGGEAYSGGGGGRIAVIYNTTTQALLPLPTIVFKTMPGTSNIAYGYGDVGTLYFPDNRLLTETFPHAGQWWVPGTTNWSPNALTVTNGWLRFPSNAFMLAVADRLEVVGTDLTKHKLEMSNAVVSVGGDMRISLAALNLFGTTTPGLPALDCAGSLNLTNGGTLALYGGPTNDGSGTAAGSSLGFTNALRITGSASTLYLYGHPTNGGAPIVCAGSVTVGPGGMINADGGGFMGRAQATGYGPGGGSGYMSGGSYGGRGSGSSGPVYGDPAAPLLPGSGGGAYPTGDYPGGRGGGVVRLEVAGIVDVNGTISANGTNGPGASAGGGSGGGVHITCSGLTGTSGVIRANGSNGNGSYGSGGGGRIAVVYDTGTQAGLPVPGITFQATPGMGATYGDIGSIYFPDTRLLTETLTHVGQWYTPGLTNWAPASLLVTNAWIRFPIDGFRLAVGGKLRVVGTDITRHKFELTNAVVSIGSDIDVNKASLNFFAGNVAGLPSVVCGHNLTLANGATMRLFSGPTNDPSPKAYSAFLNVTNDLQIGAAGSALYLYAHPTNGGAALVAVKNLAIASGCSINADGAGFVGREQNWGYGPGGAFNYRGGGGYGGVGGVRSGSIGGVVYGSSNAPVSPGSAGGAYNPSPGHPGCAGGGAVRILASGTVTVDGTITADGATTAPIGNTFGAGSGGGIYLYCRTFAGSAGTIRARGGSGGYANGGGGRIAIWRAYDSAAGMTVSAAAGTTALGDSPGNGTIVYMQATTPTGLIISLQ